MYFIFDSPLHRISFSEPPGELVYRQISRNCIEIENPISTSKSYFLAHRGQKIVLERNLSDLLKLHPPEINLHNALKNIIEEDKYSPNTIWKGVEQLLPGSVARITFDSFNRAATEIRDDFSESIALSGEDPMTVLAEEIKEKAKSVKLTNVAISFSGGRDSTALLAAAQVSKNLNIAAFTWTYDRGSAHEDLFASYQSASRAGIPHYTVDINPENLFSLIDKGTPPSTISSSIAFQNFKMIFEQFIASKFSSEALILDGHGGDHAYLDPVPLEVISDIRKKFGVLAALMALKNPSQINGANIFQLWNHHQKRLNFQATFARSIFKQSALEMITPKPRPASCKEIHHAMIKQAVFQNSTNSATEICKRFTPFTSPRHLATTWGIPAESFFDGKTTRLPFKLSFEAFCQERQLFRQDKGHITGAYQHALQIKKNELTERVREGRLNKEGLLNFDKFLHEYSKCALGYTGVNEILTKIICFEQIASA